MYYNNFLYTSSTPRIQTYPVAALLLRAFVFEITSI